MGSAAPSPDAPFVLKGSDGRRRVVTAANTAALCQGIVCGMPLTKAQALVEDLIICDSDPVADADGLDKLAVWALKRYAPIAAADPPDGLILDTSGADHLRGGEAAMLRDMVAQLSTMGVTAWVAVADTWGAAHAAARYSGRRGHIVAPGQSPQVLLDLPVAALRLPEDMVRSLWGLGFERIAQLVAQPRAPLTLRYGPELGRRLDQAFGRFAEPIPSIHMPEIPQVKRVFAEPIGAPETLARYTTQLIHKLCDVLEVRSQGATQLDLLFVRVDNRVEAVRVRLAQPSRDAKRLARLLCDKIETVNPGFGIEVMRLAATGCEPLVLKQIDTADDAGAHADIAGLMDILANRFGAERLYRLAPVASDVPERSMRKVPPLSCEPVTSPQVAAGPRPTRLFARPEAIATMAELPDHAPGAFWWRGHRRRVLRADGPERIRGEWWIQSHEAFKVRDYFQVETETGERFWIYRSGDGEHKHTGPQSWFLHGIFA